MAYTEKEVNSLTEKFFELRFPDKSIETYKRHGYFQQWITRFSFDNPEVYMDGESKAIWEQMQEDLEGFDKDGNAIWENRK